MNDHERDELIKGHKRIKLTEIDVLRRLELSESDCLDEGTIRRFCHANKRTLPDMIELVLESYDGPNALAATPRRRAEYRWHITVYENPNLKEEIQ